MPINTNSPPKSRGTLIYQLPIEIHTRIINLMPRSELGQYRRTCIKFFLLTLPQWYKFVKLRLAGDHSTGDLPLLFEPISKLRAHPKLKIINQFIHTTHLTLMPHPNHKCPSLSPLSPITLPNLHTLIIKPNKASTGFDACGIRMNSTLPTNKFCPLLTNLRPKQVELGDCHTGFYGSGLGLWTSSESTFPPPWLEYLIVNIGNGAPNGNLWQKSGVLLRNLPDTIKRVSIVLCPTEVEGGTRWEWKEGWKAWVSNKHTWVQLARAIFKCQAREVEIVGLEVVDESWKGWTMEEVRRKAIEILVVCLEQEFNLQTLESTDQWIDRLVFTKVEDFLAR